MMKFSALILSLTLVSQAALAKILVISDIDDTIKVTHVLAKSGAATSFVDESSRFAGMPELYQLLKKSHKDIEFHYVSLAPWLLMRDKHEDFLEENDFPITKLHMNMGIKQDPELKQKVIRKLLDKKKPELVIYFGDNGQFDTVVYDQMVKEYPQIPYVSYIREAYSSLGESKYPTLPGQIGFVTTVEVAIDLIQKKILPENIYGSIEREVFKRLLRDEEGGETFGKMVFPWWQDCRDFKWQWTVENPSLQLLAIESAIAKKCQK
ncbi:phosphatidate phosphatase App1 family protein [uncultured Bdellovibrio sp.]|uniref:phosphatidate phosphatase App1 family protein n=1 Tax=Bdellovibrio sp. HCB-162 TaxID=3394234 RepID=UPI0025E1AE96|nr:phosphatase domain-containing protein [uncultured Bdellovibrio sp.]